jgi:hypothetical protein
MLPFDLIHKVKIGLVEMMHTNVTIFSTTAVACALGVHSDIVQRPEVTPHTANLLLEDFVIKPCLELSLSCAGRCDVHGSLTTTENNVVLDGRDCGAVERGIGGVGLENLEAVCSPYLKLLALDGSAGIG